MGIFLVFLLIWLGCTSSTDEKQEAVCETVLRHCCVQSVAVKEGVL